MPTDEQWDIGSFDEDSGGGWADEGGAQRPKKQGMSTFLKVVIFLGCIAGGGVLLCCGGGAWWINSIQTENPQEVIARTKEMVDIEIPDDFQPQKGMNANVFGFKMKLAVYKLKSADGMLMLMSMSAAEANQDAQMRNVLQGEVAKNLTINNLKTRKFEVRGEIVDFKFAQSENMDNGDPWRQVTGTFAGKEGTVMLMLQIEEEAYDEDVVIKMIESIK